MLYRFPFTCVIYGWDASCEASDSWIDEMGVNDLKDKQCQPFYHVIDDEGSTTYVAQGASFATKLISQHQTYS